MNKRWLVPFALSIAALAAGCGDSGEPRSAPNVETRAAGAATPPGFVTRVVKEQGFSVALPKSWRSVDAHQALSSRMKEFRKANPQIGRQIEALAQPNSPIKLLAIGPRVGGFTTNLNVIVTRIPASVGFADWTAAEIANIRKVTRVARVKREDLQMNPGRAVHLTYQARFNSPRGPFASFVHQYMVKNDGFLYILTYSTLPSAEPRYRDTFAASARSFRLVG